MSLRRLLVRLRSLWNRAQIDEELAEEIDAHIEMEQEEQVVAGRTPDDARAAALRAFGNVTLRREDGRAAWTFQWIETLWQDAQHAARMLRRNPGFTAIAVATLALGLGATTTIFSVVNSILLRPLPYPDSQRLISVYSAYSRFQGFRIAVSMRDWNRMRTGTHSFDSASFFVDGQMDLLGGTEPQKVSTCQVSPGFFDLFGQSPSVGRFFVPSEEDPAGGRGQVAVLSWGFWQSRLGGDVAALGKSLTLNGKLYTIVGVTHAGFDLPGVSGKDSTQIWLPIQSLPSRAMNAHFKDSLAGEMYARLTAGSSVAKANIELNGIGDALAREYPANDKEWTLHAMGAQEQIVGDQRTPLLVLLAGVALLLLIACANVASLVLSRGIKREGEFALRSALGASRVRVFRQIVTESFVLALLGGVAGCLLVVGGIAAFRAFAPESLPRLDEVHASLSLLAFGFAGVLLAGVIFGLAPVLQTARVDVMTALKQAGTGRSTFARRGLRSAVVVVEIGFALALTIGSVLLIQSLSKLINQPTGMRIDHILTMNVELPQSAPSDRVRGDNFVRRVLENIQASAGVESVAAADIAVLSGGTIASHVRVEGNPETAQGVGNIELSDVTPGFFQTLRIPLLEGRSFTLQDVAGASLVAILNRKVVEQLWGKRDPIGTRVSFDTDEKGQPIWLTVIGVVADTRDTNVQTPPRGELYTPLLQQTNSLYLSFLVRTHVEPASVLPAVKQAIWNVDRTRPVTDVETLDEIFANEVAEPAFRTWLLGTFASLGLILAAVGIYGVVSYSVARRTREIGIRMALGAQRRSVLRLVLTGGMTLVIAGIGLGLALALGLAKLMAGILYGVGAWDATAFWAGGVVLAAVGFLACYMPARRATRVDPLIALRYE